MSVTRTACCVALLCISSFDSGKLVPHVTDVSLGFIGGFYLQRGKILYCFVVTS